MKSTSKILVIDDELSILTALNIILEDEGYEVVTTTTGIEGIRQFHQQHFDITISDLCLPDMTGLDVIDQICEIQPGSRVILITSFDEPETIVKAEKCGFAGFLLKPFEPSEIINLLETLQS